MRRISNKSRIKTEEEPEGGGAHETAKEFVETGVDCNDDAGGLFSLLFYADNKYQTPPPYGKSGIITLNEQDLQRDNPVFLIDGWLLTDALVADKPTYIGEFSNLQRGICLFCRMGRQATG